MRIWLWRCGSCNITFGVRVEDADLYEFTSSDADRLPCCPNPDCRDNDGVESVGDPAGYEVPYEAAD